MHYANHTLTEYLQSLSDEELEQAEMSIMADDILGIRIDILGTIRNEFEYRKSDELLVGRSK